MNRYAEIQEKSDVNFRIWILKITLDGLFGQVHRNGLEFSFEILPQRFTDDLLSQFMFL